MVITPCLGKVTLESLKTKFKVLDIEIKFYIVELETFNFKLQKQIAKLEAQNVGYQNTISALKKRQPKVIIKVQHFDKLDSKDKK